MITVKDYLEMVYAKTTKALPKNVYTTDNYSYFVSDRYVSKLVTGASMVYLGDVQDDSLWIAIVKKGSRTAENLLRLGAEIIPEVYLERNLKIGA